MSGLLQYIRFIQQGGRGTCTLYIVGNQSADLDSVVSSLVLAYALAQLAPYNLQVYPIINTGRKRFSEFTTAAIGTVHITPDLLFFIEDPVIKKDIWRQHTFSGRKWILVDHNEVNESNKGWWERGCVVGVLDHHVEQPKPEMLAKNTNMIYCNSDKVLGSTTTLITEMVLGLDPPDGGQHVWLEKLIKGCGFDAVRKVSDIIIDRDCLSLLLMTLQEDTADFAPDLYGNRWQDRDRAAAEALLKALDLADGSIFQEARKTAREKALAFVAQESWIKILQSDLKIYHGITPRPLPFASVPFPLHVAGRTKELAVTLLNYLEGNGMNEMCVLSRDGSERCLWHFQLLGSPTELKQVLTQVIPDLNQDGEANSRYASEVTSDCTDLGVTVYANMVDFTWSRKLLEGKLRDAFATRLTQMELSSETALGDSMPHPTPADEILT